MLNLHEEVLLDGGCFGESEHVEVLDDAGAAMQQDRDFLRALASVRQLIHTTVIVSILVFLTAFVPFQIALRQDLLLAFVQGATFEPASVLKWSVVTWSLRFLTLLDGHRREVVVFDLGNWCHVRALLLTEVDVIQFIFFHLVSILDYLQTLLRQQAERTCNKAYRIVRIITVS